MSNVLAWVSSALVEVSNTLERHAKKSLVAAGRYSGGRCCAPLFCHQHPNGSSHCFPLIQFGNIPRWYMQCTTSANKLDDWLAALPCQNCCTTEAATPTDALEGLRCVQAAPRIYFRVGTPEAGEANFGQAAGTYRVLRRVSRPAGHFGVFRA